MYLNHATMIAVEEKFSSIESIKKRWHWNMPWGAGDGKLGVYSEYKNIFISPKKDGIVMLSTLNTDGWDMPRLFWGGAPMGFGRYTAEMTVPNQSSVNVFVLYTQAHYNNVVRTIMPEIDIAEYGIHNAPNSFNIAVHRWGCNPSWKNDPRYLDIERRHELDYVGHKQTNKILEWTGKRMVHSCEVSKNRCSIFLNGKKKLTVKGTFHPFFTPTFGQVLPNWIRHPYVLPITLHSFTYES